MSFDFTLAKLSDLYSAIIDSGYQILRFIEYLENTKYSKIVLLRHDVDNKITNAFKIAVLENSIGIKATFYIRYRKDLFKEAIINRIADMGHEIGYHYEDLSLAKGNFKKAISLFENKLAAFRHLYPVKTICMHGSPISNWDNRLLWEEYDYRNFGIVGEPYLDINFNNVLYLTDTGRRWNGADVSMRDKVATNFNYRFKSTDQIIKALYGNQLPDKIMINIHPHSWSDKPIPWLKELIWQNTKNICKRFLVKFGNNAIAKK
jgi:hypothetical protein